VSAADWGPVPTRLVVGGGLAYHGFPKLFSKRGHENIVSMLKTMGVPEPELAGWAVGLVEFFGGLAIAAGARTKFVSALIYGEVVINLLAALARGGFPQPLPGCQPLPGVESSLFYGAGSLSLMLTGPGPCSVDARRQASRG
jgi:putative oxidoreductase